VFRHGESTGTIDLTKHGQAELATTWVDHAVGATRAAAAFNRAYWRMLLRIAGTAPSEWGAS